LKSQVIALENDNVGLHRNLTIASEKLTVTATSATATATATAAMQTEAGSVEDKYVQVEMTDLDFLEATLAELQKKKSQVEELVLIDSRYYYIAQSTWKRNKRDERWGKLMCLSKLKDLNEMKENDILEHQARTTAKYSNVVCC